MTYAGHGVPARAFSSTAAMASRTAGLPVSNQLDIVCYGENIMFWELN